MPNHIKNGTSTLASVTKGAQNFGITGQGDYGPSSSTGFYQGITPPVGGYTIYVNRVSVGPSIHVANNDTQCIFFLKSFGATGSTISEVLAWATAQTTLYVATADFTSANLLTVPYKYGSPTVLFDFGDTSNYGNGVSSVVNDLSGNANNGVFITGTSAGTPANKFGYTSTSPGYFTFQSSGQPSIKSDASNNLLKGTASYTYVMWFRHLGFEASNHYPGVDSTSFEWIFNDDTANWRTWHNRAGNYAMLDFNTGGVPARQDNIWYMWVCRYDGATAYVDMYMNGTRYGASTASTASIGAGGYFRIPLRFNNWLHADIGYYAAYNSHIGTAALDTIYTNTKSRFGY